MSSSTLRIALAQLNLLVGDIEGNAQAVIQAVHEARGQYQANLIVFPELTLTGYPPEDLLLRPGLHRRVEAVLEDIKLQISGIDVILGLPIREGEHLYNSAVLLRDGGVIATYHKQILPNYRVFDEKRYFKSGNTPTVVDIKGTAIGITICEDIWRRGPARQAVEQGAQCLININASPYYSQKSTEREDTLRERAGETGVPIVYVNLVGGQDELVFDGESLVMSAGGELTMRAPAFESGVYIYNHAPNARNLAATEPLRSALSLEQSMYSALVLGVRDYVTKNGFDGTVIGLSGGIDSALTLAIAVDALGADQVLAVMMPSRYTAKISLDGAQAEADSLGIEYREISIEPMYQPFLDALAEPFRNLPTDTTEENIQARVRGVILMAFSNKLRRMVLTTGNKSEMAVGYATLYGDMAGGFAPLKDVSKSWVFHLARYRNTLGRVIPEAVIDRPPSAELAPDQKDEDSLPPYDVLDPILEMFVEQDKTIDQITDAGFEGATVKRVVAMVLRNEYKRRQAPPGVRITRRAYGKDRRYPITSGFGKRLYQ